MKSQLTAFTQAANPGWKAENAQKRMDTLLAGVYARERLDGILAPNVTRSHHNGVKIVPARLLDPQIVTLDNVRESYANDPVLKDLVKQR